MTTNTIARLIEYLEDGATTTHPIPFKFLAASDLVVERIVGNDLTTLELGVDYSATGAGEPGGGELVKSDGGTDGATLRIRCHTSRAQSMDYTPHDTFPAESHEGALDRLALVDQEIEADVQIGLARSLLVPVGETAPAMLGEAEREAGKMLGFGVAGVLLALNPGGADDGLREDLATNANSLARVVFPGFPAIVTSLGDLLPTIAASKFFGIVSDGATEESASWNAAIAAMQNSSNPKGRTIFNEGGATSVIEGQIVVRPGVTVDLRGGLFDAQFAGGSDPAVRMMPDACLRGGTVAVTSTAPGATQDMAHAAIGFGALLGAGGPASDPSEFVTVSSAELRDLRVSTTRDGGIAIVILGDVYDCTIEGVRVPASATLRGAISLDWGVVGETVFDGDVVQGIWSDADRQQLNRDAYDAWVADNSTGAYTTHPRGNTSSNFLVGELTRPYTGSSDTGTFLARVSGGHGNRFENFIGAKTTEAGLKHEAGDVGYEFARPEDVPVALCGNEFDNFEIRDAYRGHAAQLTSLADNLDEATATDQLDADGNLTGDFYEPARPALLSCDVEVTRLRARTLEGANALEGVFLSALNGGTIAGAKMYGFKNNLRATASHDVDVVKFCGENAWQHGIYILDVSSNIHLIDTKRSAYSGQALANTWDDLHVHASSGVIIDGGCYGADDAAPQCRSSIRINNSGDGVTGLSIRNTPTANAHGAGNVAVKLGASDNDQTLCWEVSGGFRYGGNVISKYNGLRTVPTRRRFDSAGNILTDWDTFKANTMANQLVWTGDRFWLIDAVSGEPAVRVAVASATIDGTGSDRDVLTETLGVLS